MLIFLAGERSMFAKVNGHPPRVTILQTILIVHIAPG
jgi:hypothetical protein